MKFLMVLISSLLYLKAFANERDFIEGEPRWHSSQRQNLEEGCSQMLHHGQQIYGHRNYDYRRDDLFSSCRKLEKTSNY